MSVHMIYLKLTGIVLLVIGLLPRYIEVDTPLWIHVVCVIFGLILILVRENEIFEFQEENAKWKMI